MDRKGTKSLIRVLGGFLIFMLVLSAIAMIGTFEAQAADKLIEWIPPTHCDDERAQVPIGETVEIETAEGLVRITCGELLTYRLECAVNDTGPPYDDLEWNIDAPATSDLRDYPPGEYRCRLSTSNEGGFSRWSDDELFFSITVPEIPIRPNPPSGIVVSDGA